MVLLNGLDTDTTTGNTFGGFSSGYNPNNYKIAVLGEYRSGKDQLIQKFLDPNFDSESHEEEPAYYDFIKPIVKKEVGDKTFEIVGVEGSHGRMSNHYEVSLVCKSADAVIIANGNTDPNNDWIHYSTNEYIHLLDNLKNAQVNRYANQQRRGVVHRFRKPKKNETQQQQQTNRYASLITCVVPTYATDEELERGVIAASEYFKTYMESNQHMKKLSLMDSLEVNPVNVHSGKGIDQLFTELATRIDQQRRELYETEKAKIAQEQDTTKEEQHTFLEKIKNLLGFSKAAPIIMDTKTNITVTSLAPAV